MKVSELRIENLFYKIDRTQKVHMPIEVPMVVAEIGIPFVKFYPLGTPIEQVTKYFDVELFSMTPIPLTEEWLLKFGFEEEKESDNFSKWWIGENPLTHDWLFLIKQHKSTNIFFYENGYNEVKSIHHLQNLFNAITQTELTINN
jgi:hypothetical protein